MPVSAFGFQFEGVEFRVSNTQGDYLAPVIQTFTGPATEGEIIN